ncbi:hypothetical protein HU200_000947 [Digitaria exilis]|uniref:Uncharacterized protein n=1 Tax=Digitaria exilis TaxID=1010633 RepID=A0A835G102_9POAL|nr:hypothetical protein HU200_000947 [Digitaria exilis]
MCLGEETSGEHQVHDVIDANTDIDANANANADIIDANAEAFVKAPASSDPAGFREADELRDLVDTWVEGIRGEAGRPAISAAMFRRRRAIDHRDMALEFAQRRKVAVGMEDDELCWSVQDAMDAQVIGCCAYCGCNFSVVAVVNMPGIGGLCGVCGRQVRVHESTPPVRDLPENAEERWKGWLPW